MPNARSLRLSRRTFLKSGAVTIALPLLDAMLPLARAAGESPQNKNGAPKRLIILMRPLGTYAPYFFPEKAGLDYEAPRFLKHLEDHRGKFTVFSGMSHLGYPNDHRTEFAVLSGVHPDNIKRMDDMHNTITLDQQVVEVVGRQTRLPYLLLGPMHEGLSSNRKGISLPGMRRQSEVFRQLFINGTPDEVAREVHQLQDGKSILDGMRDQLGVLSRGLGSEDRRRMEMLTTSIREAEQRLQQEEAWAAKPKPRVEYTFNENPAEWVSEYRQWHDMMHLACQTDSTRVMVCRTPEQPAAPTAPGTRLGEHDASHHGKQPDKIEQVALFEEAHIKLLDHLMKKLAETTEGDGTLLDNTQVLYASNLGDGSAHASNNLPILLAGGGFKHRGHVAFDRDKNYPLSNLYVRMLQKMGIEADKFGSSTSVVSELG